MHAQHDVLRHLLGLRREALAEDREREAEHRTAVAAHELGERVGVASVTAAGHQCVIAVHRMARQSTRREMK